MASNKKVLVIGSLVSDVIIHSTPDFKIIHKYLAFPFDSKTQLDRVYLDPGGSAHNLAANLAKMGNKVYILGKVGDDFNGEMLLKNLSGVGVDISFVKKEKAILTGISLIFIKNREKAILTYRGANNLAGEKDIDEKLFKKIKLLVFTSMVSTKNVRLLKKAISEARKNNVKILANPSISMINHRKKELKTFLKKSNIIIMNKKESLAVTGKKNISDALRKLKNYGAETVIITEDKKGCVMLGDGKQIKVPAYKIKIADTTGAGDSFTAGFIHAKFKGCNNRDAIKFANALAALNIATLGATVNLPSEKEVLNFLKKRGEKYVYQKKQTK